MPIFDEKDSLMSEEMMQIGLYEFVHDAMTIYILVVVEIIENIVKIILSHKYDFRNTN